MIKATKKDRDRVIGILAESFNDNQSVNYIMKQDTKRNLRIRRLMAYSFEICFLFGDVFLNADKTACALMLYPDRKRATFKSIFLDIQLILLCIGIRNTKKALARESKIKKLRPKDMMYYLWFIGVDPESQNKGTGSELLNDIIKNSDYKERSIYLETSTLKNLPWYRKFGFQVYDELDLGYQLFFLKRS